MRTAALRCARVALVRRHLSTSACASSSDLPVQRPTASAALEETQLSIEKKSLSRGLALDRFEKDFFIYPEYTHTDEAEKIKAYAEDLAHDLDKALTLGERRDGSLPSAATQTLAKHGVHGFLVGKDFGGVGTSQKDLLVISEVLGRDLSLFTTYSVAHTAASVLSVFGNDAQREKYLPRIASGECKAAVCFLDDYERGGDTEVLVVPGDSGKLSGVKKHVINAQVADIFLVIANRKYGEKILPTCFVIDKSETKDGTIVVSDKLNTQGLKSLHISSVEFKDVPVGEENVLGQTDIAEELAREVVASGKLLHAAAVCGFLKKLLGNLSDFSNRTLTGNKRLSDNPSIQTVISDLSLQLYVLESIVYYIGGITDEGLFLANDVENAVMQRFINRALRQAIVAISEIGGIAAVDASLGYEEKLRDIVTFLSMSQPDLALVDRIAVPTVESWIATSGNSRRLDNVVNLKRILADEDIMTDFDQPKLKHFIAEYVHPSLEHFTAARVPVPGAVDGRLNKTIGYVVTQRGNFIRDDPAILWSIATVIENNLGMTATITRVSRSYSIGLRNCDLELAWTLYYATRKGRESQITLSDLTRENHLFSMNPNVLSIGRDVLQNKGYPIESPIERNW
ncbi:CBN-ACDH-13 protein [Aphelenchoides avenae]|nr:CBN-ACDH-13 protein [Aphelenchus avenae]